MAASEYEFHPLAEAYPLLVGDSFRDLCADIEANGLDKDIYLYEGKILDGRNRFLACNQVGVEPRFALYTGDDPEGFVATQNDHRRHESQESLQKRRAARIERVADLRREGKSQREIADTIGISRSQVQRDIEDSTGPGGPVEPKKGKVTGKDGRTRTAKPKKPAREREPGEDDGDFDQKDAAKDAKRREANKPQPKSKDATGRVIPDTVKDVFGDTCLADCLAELDQAKQLVTRVHERFKRKIQYYPFAHTKEALDGCAELEYGLQSVSEAVSPGQPFAICPVCEGDCAKCKTCRFSGHLPEWRFKELQEQGAF